MEKIVVDWTIQQLYERRTIMSFPEYQREAKLWQLKDKQLLIDSILNGIDIPKLYFFKVRINEYEVVDGQQRLWAIWEFIDDLYSYEINKIKRKFSKLSKNTQKKIFNYKLQIAEITKATDDELRTLFIRLQLGLLLNTGEKLNARKGSMKDFVFNVLKKHPFIEQIKIPKRRYAKQTLCAQICINSFSRQSLKKEFRRTRYEDLDRFFREYAKLDGGKQKVFNKMSQLIIKVLDLLDSHFKKKANILKNRSFILSVYLYVEELVSIKTEAEINTILPVFVEFCDRFIILLKEEAKAGINRKNEVLYKFESFLSNAPGERYQIERRHEQLKEIFKYFQDMGKIKGDIDLLL